MVIVLSRLQPRATPPASHAWHCEAAAVPDQAETRFLPRGAWILPIFSLTGALRPVSRGFIDRAIGTRQACPTNEGDSI